MTNYLETYAENSHQRFVDGIEALAARYEELAAEIRREGRVRESSTFGAVEGFEHLYSVQQVQHTIAWATANTNFDGLIQKAIDADHSATLAKRGEE